MSILEFISVSAGGHFCRTMNGAHKLHPANERLSLPVLISFNTSLPVCINGTVRNQKNPNPVLLLISFWCTLLTNGRFPLEAKAQLYVFFTTKKELWVQSGGIFLTFWFFYSFTHTDPIVSACFVCFFPSFSDQSLSIVFYGKFGKLILAWVGKFLFLSFSFLG